MKDIKEITNAIFCGNSGMLIRELPAESVDCCITSPPYWNLRDYGVEGQNGNESDYRDYLARLWNLFDGVQDALKPTGTLWVNLGDTYTGGGGASGHTSETKNFGRTTISYGAVATGGRVPSGMKPKCLCMIPERFAIRMVERGWILRNTIIWHKPNCMPASVTDRFTVDFEPVYFFTKKEHYYFEQQYEPIAESTIRRGKVDYGGAKGREYKKSIAPTDPNFRNGNEQWGRTFDYTVSCKNGRNKRAVWRITTKPFSGAHFAVFPEKLIEPMVKAGCPPGGIVLDPFMGSGTTCMVAKRLGRAYCGIDLKPEYVEMARQRINGIPERLDSYVSHPPQVETQAKRGVA